MDPNGLCALRIAGGIAEVIAGIGVAIAGGPIGIVAGALMVANGLDNIYAGTKSLITGEYEMSLLESLIYDMVPEEWAPWVYMGTQFLIGGGGWAATKLGRLKSVGAGLVGKLKTSRLGNEIGEVGDISKIAKNPLVKYDEAFATNQIKRLAEAHITDTGVTVLGRYHPLTNGVGQYIAKANKLKASYFDLGDVYKMLSPQQQKIANFHFLDIIAEKGDKVLLSVPKTKIPRGITLWDEVEYLTKEKGYHWVNQWSLQKTR